jgi:ribonuclease HI
VSGVRQHEEPHLHGVTTLENPPIPAPRVAATSLTVATDGACSGNPGPAGWSWVDEHGTWRCGGMLRSTNQVGELVGLLNAVRDHHHVADLTIEIDSAYAMNTYLEWMDAHARRGWTTAAGKPTSNVDVISQLLDARDRRASAGCPR